MSTAVAGYKRSFGSDGPPGAYEDFERADVILLIGANIADNHPILCRRLEANPGTTLIVVDPRVTKTAMLADLHLPIRPRADLALLNGLIHIIIERDLVDHEYIERHTTGFDALRESVSAVHARARGARSPGSNRICCYRTAALYAGARAGVHRMDDGGESQHEGHRDRQRDQQPRADHRQHRPHRRGAVLDHRPVQRHGHARGRIRLEPAGLPHVRECRRIARSWRRSGTCRSSGFPTRAAWPIPTSSRRRSTSGSARSGSSRPTRSCRSRTWAR